MFLFKWIINDHLGSSERIVDLERIYISYYSLLSNPNAQYNMLVTYICINMAVVGF